MSSNIQCDICCRIIQAKQSYVKRSLFRHYLCQHVRLTADDKLLCAQCDYNSIRGENVARHWLSEHSEYETRDECICNDCDIAYVHPNGLQRHVAAVHLAESLCCDSCDIGFSSRNALCNHVKASNDKLRCVSVLSLCVQYFTD